jgi:hypothetical protein
MQSYFVGTSRLAFSVLPTSGQYAHDSAELVQFPATSNIEYPITSYTPILAASRYRFSHLRNVCKPPREISHGGKRHRTWFERFSGVVDPNFATSPHTHQILAPISYSTMIGTHLFTLACGAVLFTHGVEASNDYESCLFFPSLLFRTCNAKVQHIKFPNSHILESEILDLQMCDLQY